MSGVSRRAIAADRTKTTMMAGMLWAAPSMKVTAASGRRVPCRAATGGSASRRCAPRSRGGQPRHGEPLDDLGHLCGKPALGSLVVTRPDRLDDDPTDRAHLVLAEAAGCRSRRAQPDAGCRVGRQRVERDAVLVHGDPDLVEQVLGLLARHAE